MSKRVTAGNGKAYRVSDEEYSRGWAQVGKYRGGELEGLPILWDKAAEKTPRGVGDFEAWEAEFGNE